ncbi:MAG: UDP-3-O-acyl-N-acetylglucosamine deacetylase [Trueperaceae bacterium]|nr:UDP-3-O-acyl-N-acetylglucosamine deacetylase [Trueperaceae bacterium]
MSSAPTLAGHGVHSGTPCTVRLHRYDGPVVLRRAGRTIAPRISAVVGARGATILGADGVRAAMVEHLFAALQIRDVWSGVLIEVDADELPILDGSAAPWYEALNALAPFPPPPEPWRVDAEIRREDGAYAGVKPGPRELDVQIAFDHPAVGTQAWQGAQDAWPELLAARTFGFARDAATLRAAGLASGAKPENAIVFGDDAPLEPLRFPDEPVRHKALDALGDLYLLGRPFAGRLRVRRGGHDLHHRLVTRIVSSAGSAG